MWSVAKLIATAGGVGACPLAPGTVGSLVGVGLAWLAASRLSIGWCLVSAVIACGVGVVASGRAARELGIADPSVVVIDEVVGMWLVFAVVPQALRVWWLGVAAFVLFRAFDTLKPPPLRRLERFPRGWGIILDDLGAAAYTCVVLTLLQWRSG